MKKCYKDIVDTLSESFEKSRKDFEELVGTEDFVKFD